MKTRCWVWTASKDGCGYGWIGLGDGSGKLGKANRVAWELQHGPLLPKECALHHCDNPSCVRWSHLFKGTQKNNAIDREKKGRGNHSRGDAHHARRHPERLKRGDAHHMRRPEFRPRGEKNPNATLTTALVHSIREEHAAGGVNYLQLAVKYNTSPTTIGSVVRRRTWKDV